MNHHWQNQHWNGNVFILTTFTSLVAPEVPNLATSGAAIDENFVKMCSFQWMSSHHFDGWLRADALVLTTVSRQLQPVSRHTTAAITSLHHWRLCVQGHLSQTQNELVVQILEIHMLFLHALAIGSGHNFAHSTTNELSWIVHFLFDWCSRSVKAKRISTSYFSYELKTLFVQWVACLSKNTRSRPKSVQYCQY